MTDETVGSYQLVEKLGEGGMGEVYAAEHKYIQRRAAIKFLLPELTGSSDLVGRFFDEARAASVIKHVGIVEVYDCDMHRDGRAYIVMELLNGESLRDYLERVGKLDGDEAGTLAICAQMVSALAAAHAQGIIHRDLKPDNVFLHLALGTPADQPIVKLLDFGIAKLQGGGETGGKTRTGQLLGTPQYMSPEQCRGARQIDYRSDIYSFGCILYETFCGRPPFIEEGFGDLIVAHISQSPPEPLQFAPAMTPTTREIILRCLSKRPEDRPASMKEVASILAAAGAVETARLSRPVKPAARPERPAARSASPRLPAGWGAGPAGAVATTPFPQAPPSGHPTPGAPPARAARTPPQIGGTKLLPTPTTLSRGAKEVPITPPPRRERRQWAMIGAAIVGMVAVTAVILRGVTATTDKTRSAAGLAAPAEKLVVGHTADDQNPFPRRAVPEPPAEPAQSSIRLSGLPAGATVLLDGVPASLPLIVPRDTVSHRVAVEADGFDRWEGTINSKSDQVISVHLKPKRPEIQSPAKAKRRIDHSHRSPGFSGFDDL